MFHFVYGSHCLNYDNFGSKLSKVCLFIQAVSRESNSRAIYKAILLSVGLAKREGRFFVVLRWHFDT